MEQGTTELAEIRGKLNEQQKSFESERIAWINDKKTLEDTIVDLSTSEKQTENDRNSREREVKELEERAKVWTLLPYNLLGLLSPTGRTAEIFSRNYCSCRLHESPGRAQKGACNYSSFSSGPAYRSRDGRGQINILGNKLEATKGSFG